MDHDGATERERQPVGRCDVRSCERRAHACTLRPSIPPTMAQAIIPPENPKTRAAVINTGRFYLFIAMNDLGSQKNLSVRI